MGAYSGSWENDAGSGHVDYCLGSMYLLNTFLHNSVVVDKETEAQRGKLTHHSVKHGLGDRPGLRWPLGCFTQTLKTGGFNDCYDYMEDTKFNQRPKTLELGLSPLAFPQRSQDTTPGLGSQGAGTLPFSGKALGYPLGSGVQARETPCTPHQG